MNERGNFPVVAVWLAAVLAISLLWKLFSN
jgi:hypothetical protein